MMTRNIAGWLLMAIIAFGAQLLSDSVSVSGAHPLEASVIAIVIGLIIRSINLTPEICVPGVKAYEKLLIMGIVLSGAALRSSDLVAHGLAFLEIVLITLMSGLLITYFLGKLFKLTHNMCILLAVGTSICGGTAIAVTSPIIKAKEEETSYAVGVISLLGLLAILFYPMIARAFSISDLQFGVLAGTAIHSTPQVIGAGFAYSIEAGNIATTVKLLRNCFLAPVALLIAWWISRSIVSEERAVRRGAFPWFLFAYFIVAAITNSGFIDPGVVSFVSDAGKKLVLISMVGVGLSTDIFQFKKVGAKPLVVGTISAACVAAVSLTLISFIL